MDRRRVLAGVGAGFWAGSVAMAGLLIAGCSNIPPSGSRSGRVEVTDTTPAEANSRQVLPTALVEFSDQVAQQLVADMQQIPELNGGYRATVVFGDIANNTQVVPTTDFEAFRNRIRQKLMQSRSVLANVRFVENRARMEALRRREGGGGGDLLQQSPGGAAAGDALVPEYTFFLNGDMYRVTRGSQEQVNLYMLSFNLTNMQSGELIWTNSPYEIKQVR